MTALSYNPITLLLFSLGSSTLDCVGVYFLDACPSSRIVWNVGSSIVSGTAVHGVGEATIPLVGHNVGCRRGAVDASDRIVFSIAKQLR